ncbi:MAG: ribonuclease E/G, partial [Sutterella sp.]
REARKSNIYKGIVTRIEPSLEACFVNYGEERHGFLPFKEISRAYFKEGVDVRTASIREAITEGQELIVQVEKEERGNKGAALTTFISLAGRYLVLMPNNPRGGGVSRRIEGEERQELREAMEKLDLPSGMSTIARTAGIGRTTEELQWDLNYLLKLWEAISDAAAPQYELMREENGRRVPAAVTTPVVDGKPLKRLNPPPFLIVEESNLVVRAIRDYFQRDIGEILVDTDEIYEQARQFMAHVMPDMVSRVKRYREDIPLFTRFQIEHQIETAYSRTVPLPSGGAIVIDHTEALVAIDVNSARATRGADIEETAFRTNCEAADEVARQMRLRDLGGLIVIDFIDMADTKNQRAVEQRLKDALRYDRARVQMAKISRFGLMELSRQRLRPALSEGNHITCPRCNGVGVIRDTESCALQVLRILQEEAMKEGTGAVYAQVPVDVATFLLNEKRNDITKLEARHRVPIVLIPNTHLETPHYHIERLRQDDERLEDTTPSFNRAEEVETVADDPYALKSQEDKPQRPKQIPVIKNVLPRDPAPIHVQAEKKEEAGKQVQLQPVTEKKGLFARIAAFLFGDSSKKEEEKPEDDKKSAEGKSDDREDRKRRGSRRDGRRVRRADRQERAERTERAEKSERAEKAERAEERQEEKKRRERPVRRQAEAELPREDAQQAETAEKTSRRRTRRRRSAEDEAQQPVQTAEVTQTAAEAAVPAEPASEVRAEEVRAPEAPKAEAPAEEEVRTEDAEGARPEGEEADDQQGETRRRRPRRRRRGSRADAQAQNAESAEPAEGEAATESTDASAAPVASPAEQPEAAPAAAEAAPADEQPAEAPVRVSSEAAPAQAPAEVTAEVKEAPKAEVPAVPEAAPASESGLVQIETTKPAAPSD